MDVKPRLLILASGTPTGGGSGFKNLMQKEKAWELAGVVSEHPRGGVWEKAEELGVGEHFVHFPRPWTRTEYQRIVGETRADFVACSGWLKHVKGLDPATTFNIHPGTLPDSAGTYGHATHEAMLALYKRREVMHTAICMHFVTLTYDEGPVFFRLDIPILPEDTPDSLGKRVNALEHEWQPLVTNLIVTRQIRWSGQPGDQIVYPGGYERRQMAA